MGEVAKVVLLLLLVPLLDLWLLFSIGARIGALPALGLVVGAGLLGVALGKREGRRVLGAWREGLVAGRVPDEGLTSGILVLAGAALLVAPGVVTDLLGLVLLFPPSRRRIAAALRARLERRSARGAPLGAIDDAMGAEAAGVVGGARWTVQVVHFGELGGPFGGVGAGFREGARGEVIDVEAESVSVEEDGEARAKGPPLLPP